MSFSKFIKIFFESTQTENQDKNNELLYTIYMILKRISFSNTINLNYLGLEISQLLKKINSIDSISGFFVFSKLTTLLNLEITNDESFTQNMVSSIKFSYEKLIQPFTESLLSIVGSQNNTNENSLFSYTNHIQDLLRYSHHEV